jgi:C4-dicarboxylate-specific signal transduction histidine kinase
MFEFDKTAVITLEKIAARVHPEDSHLLVDFVQKARQGVKELEYEHRLLMPDRFVKYLHLIAHAGRDKQGRLEYIGAVQDVTQRHAAEAALDRARSELANVSRITSLGALTASIAHEVNQPISGIVTNASTCLRMLAADPPNLEGARETARRAIRDGNRAAEVISRLRTLFTRRDRTVESLNLNDAIREVIALSMSEFQKNEVVLRSDLQDDLPMIRGDRVQLQQVVLNLLRNGADAMSAVYDRPRELVVRTECADGELVRLSVIDVGTGLHDDAAGRLFQPFFTTKAEGMGIGLSISRSIIEAHQGTLWAVPNQGPGATFCFTVPCNTNTKVQ